MPELELTGKRSLVYSAWHRTARLRRYLPLELAEACAMIDLDGVEYCRRCWRTVALVETARDNGQSHKSTAVMRAIALELGVPALLVFYTPSDDELDVVAFRVRWIVAGGVPYETCTRDDMRGELEPAAFARLIGYLHTRHEEGCKR